METKLSLSMTGAPPLTVLLFVVLLVLLSCVQNVASYSASETLPPPDVVVTEGNEYPKWTGNFTISHEKRLTQELLRRYDLAGRGGRPVFNASQATAVEFGLGLIQMDLDERNKVLTTSMWTRLKWRDLYLTWDPGQYGGIMAVRLEAYQVWLPDIMLYNTADPENNARNALVVVFFDGTLQWVPHQIFRSSCSIDVTNFPFDAQKCHMWFGSWTHSLSEIDLSLAFDGGIDLSTFQSDYKDSCEWDIVRPEAEKKLLPENDTNPIVVLTFTLHLQRKLVFSSYILTLPCVFLAALTLVVFWLPPDRPDRTSLAMNLFSSFLVLLLILLEAAPPTASSVPILGVYYCFNMSIIMVSVFLSSLVVNIYKTSSRSKPVPRWVKLIVLRVLAKLVCIWPCCGCGGSSSSSNCCCSSSAAQHNGGRSQQQQQQSDQQKERPMNGTRTGQQGERLTTTAPLDTDEVQRLLGHPHHYRSDLPNLDRFRGNIMCPDMHSSSDPDTRDPALYAQLEDIRQAVRQMIQFTTQRSSNAASHSRLQAEWQDVARVLDRIFFFFYLILIVASILTLFPRPIGTLPTANS